MSVLKTAAAAEDNVLDAMKMAEDAVVRAARAIADGFEPITKALPEMPERRLLPSPAEAVDHTFDFVERLVVNLHDFTSRLVALVPNKVAARPTAVKASSKTQAA